MAIKYGRGKFVAHENYVAYMNMIADSPIYSDMPNLRSGDGRINWQVSSGKGTSFFEYYNARFDWWVKKADSLHLPGTGNSNDRFSIAARIIHPTKLRACRLCGQNIFIGYMYLNANLAKSWNKLVGENTFEKQEQIDTATYKLADYLGTDSTIHLLERMFPERSEFFDVLRAGDYSSFFLQTQHIRSPLLSPGFMANPPDRLDGFHDYCLHCRKNNDPGRSDENMSTYNHDRRAFMWWAEGDWKVADAIYNSAGAGVCVNCGKQVSKISPDHIGPLSCGFKQNGFFEPLCGHCNSSKNRRFTYDNVSSLIEYELSHEESAASWQVDTLWQRSKLLVQNDEDAKELSNYMRAMQDYYLRLLGVVFSKGYLSFLLTLLHPEYAYYDVTIINLDPSTLRYDSVSKTELKSIGTRSLAARSVRIAFEELVEYCSKPPERRKINRVFSAFLAEDLPKIENLLDSLPISEEDVELKRTLESNALSLDEKDSRIQGLIEAISFDSRRQKYKDHTIQLKVIVSARGNVLSKLFRREIGK